MVAQGDQFECECGSENCRGRILGWKYGSREGPIAIPLKVGAEVDSPAVTSPPAPGCSSRSWNPSRRPPSLRSVWAIVVMSSTSTVQHAPPCSRVR